MPLKAPLVDRIREETEVGIGVSVADFVAVGVVDAVAVKATVELKDGADFIDVVEPLVAVELILTIEPIVAAVVKGVKSTPDGFETGLESR